MLNSHVFYQHQDLFETQRNVDELVDDLALSLGVHRDDLNIVVYLFSICLLNSLIPDRLLQPRVWSQVR